MSIETEIVTALSGNTDAADRVRPEAAEQDDELPLVIFKRRSFEKPPLLDGGSLDLAKTVFDFECWASTKAAAHTLAEQVASALDASAILYRTREPSPEDEYEASTDEKCAPVRYSFWHA
jgi:hypothetical protein